MAGQCALRAYPMAATYGVAGGSSNTLLVYHESGVDDGTVNPAVPIVAQVTSSDFDIGDGHNFGFVWRLIPDLTFDGSNVNQPMLCSRYSPAPTRVRHMETQTTLMWSARRTTRTPEPTPSSSLLSRCMCGFVVAKWRFKVSSDEIGVQWQLGVPRIDIRPDGRR
jgi:hypothetical protein